MMDDLTPSEIAIMAGEMALVRVREASCRSGSRSFPGI
jgi:hypothetical protein